MTLDRIDNNGGDMWLGKNIQVGQPYFTTDGRVVFWLQEFEEVFNSSNMEKPKPIVAQSITNLSYIDCVPFVEFEEDVIDPIWIALKTLLNDCVSGDGSVQIPSNKVVKQAADVFHKYQQQNSNYHKLQAKQFTEADLKYAYEQGAIAYNDQTSSDETILSVEDVINSLKPKVSSIEIEMVYRVKSGTIQEHKDGKAGYEYYEPATYQKDGKTFLKVK